MRSNHSLWFLLSLRLHRQLRPQRCPNCKRHCCHVDHLPGTVANVWRRGSDAIILPREPVSIPHNYTIQFQGASGILILSAKKIAMRKARFTEYQTLSVLKSVEAGRKVKRCLPGRWNFRSH
ncbi:hypothetical protein EHW66_00535 [Erwinia psidii]|nr:hypothetical protein [Erwinia psidii]MCX8963550.1 hypothetical protein [Erwinia psidii]